MELTNIMTAREQAGLISTESAILRMDGLEDEQMETELNRIAAEQMQAAAPTPGMTNVGGLFAGLDLGLEPEQGVNVAGGA